MKPLVSVSIITFDQENYIQEAIDSVLEQKTNFEFEICIGDDGSSDRTGLICDEYASKHPEKIRVFHRDRNNVPKKYIHSGRRNFVETMQACRGKYIALLDGDDYWTDPFKLQKQVDLFNSNENISICFHQSHTLKNGEFSFFNVDFFGGKFYTFYDLIERNFISTSSCMFKKDYELFPDWLFTINAGDWGLHLWNAQKGRVAYLNNCMSVYRIHDKGIWGGKNGLEMLEKGIEILQQLDMAFNYEFHEYFKRSITNRKIRVAQRTKSVSPKKTNNSNIWKLKNWLNKKIKGLNY